MKNKLSCLCFCLLAFVAFWGWQNVCFAAEPDEAELLKRVENELNLIKTMNTRILQTSTGQPQVMGNLILKRPNRMLLTYDKPVTTSVIADGYNVIFYDKALEQVTYLDLDETPAFFILKEKFSFSDEGVRVQSVSRNHGDIEITLTMEKDPLAGQLTIVFKEKPFFLKKWYITDARRTKTSVILSETKYNVPVDDDIFAFIHPNRRQKKY